MAEQLNLFENVCRDAAYFMEGYYVCCKIEPAMTHFYIQQWNRFCLYRRLN